MLLRTVLAAVTASSLLALSSCKSETPELEMEFPAPSTYDYPNVDFSGQTARLDQMEEMTAYMKTANTQGTSLDVDVLNAMFANTDGDANGKFSFSSDKQLKNKCFGPEVATIESYIAKLAQSSSSTVDGENGTAGVVTSNDGSSAYLFDENGREYTQLIEKGLMGAVFYYQAVSVYLSDEKMDVDNTDVEEGKGTAMQHHWDEAYGYFGASVDFPENVDDVRFWAKYCNGRDDLLNTNEELGHALRDGRLAILLEDYDRRDEAISAVRKAWEDVCASTAIHYLNEAMAEFDDDAIRNHTLSEAVAFIQNLLYNEERRVSETQINDYLNTIGDNFYEVSSDDLKSVRDKLATAYDMEDIKSQL